MANILVEVIFYETETRAEWRSPPVRISEEDQWRIVCSSSSDKGIARRRFLASLGHHLPEPKDRAYLAERYRAKDLDFQMATPINLQVNGPSVSTAEGKDLIKKAAERKAAKIRSLKLKGHPDQESFF